MGLINLNCPGCGQALSMDESREFGFCMYCGTKVMVDRTIVEHRGSVKIDNSDFVQKYLLNARRALSKMDWDEVEKYFNMVEQNAPNNMEAVFFSAYGKAMSSMMSDDFFKRQQYFTILCNSTSVINDYYELTTEDKPAILKEILSYIKWMPSSNFVFKGNGYEAANVTGSRQWTYRLIGSVMQTFATELRQIQSVHNEPYIQEMLMDIEAVSAQTQKSGGCYVATCVYGSYDCPQVWTLRRYRDHTLAATRRGRAFIRTYYAVSPTLVKWFGKTKWFKKMWQGKLDRMVKRLNDEGVENTPYQDRAW